jgi:hypothetical protein
MTSTKRVLTWKIRGNLLAGEGRQSGVIHAVEPAVTTVIIEELRSNTETRTNRTHIIDMKRFTKRAGSTTMVKPATEKAPPKTEAELIGTVANIQDAAGCLLFAQRAIRAGMPALAAACDERAKALTPAKPPRARKKPARIKEAEVTPLQPLPAE